LRVSKKYFNYANTRIVIVGKQETFLQNLKKLGYTVKTFDNYAVPVTTAAATVAIKR